MDRHVVVLGGGLAGLAAAYQLLQQGCRCTLVDANRDPGGLASSLVIQGQPIERFYHFICRGDSDLVELAQELGLQDQLTWRQTRTVFYYDGKNYSFGAPWDLLFFSPVPWLERLRFGMHIMRSRYRKYWRWLDQIPATPWLIESIGERAYHVIWHPLLHIKFGEAYGRISAAWVWHRIWRVAQSRRRLWEREAFGYFSRGSLTLVEGLLAALQKAPGFSLRLGQPVKTLLWQDGRVSGVQLENEALPCDAVISTMALPQLEGLLSHAPAASQEAEHFLHNLAAIQYIGVVCLLLRLKRPFSQAFWTNTNDPHISFNGFIEQTNLNLNLRQAGLHILYIPYYLPTSEARFHASKEALLAEYIPMLQQINPLFDRSWIEESYVFRTPYAQAVCTTGFADLVPPVQTPFAGLYLTDSTQFYPEDRTLSAAIKFGRRAARLAVEYLHGGN